LLFPPQNSPESLVFRKKFHREGFENPRGGPAPPVWTRLCHAEYANIGGLVPNLAGAAAKQPMSQALGESGYSAVFSAKFKVAVPKTKVLGQPLFQRGFYG
jgi:hypothetical protein